MPSASTIEARQFVDADNRPVESADLLAAEAVRLLASHDVLVIDLGGMRGLSSSYFNVLLKRIIQIMTAADLQRRIKFTFDSPAQELVFKRSLEFVSFEQTSKS